jgi:hypothetical protein
MYINDHAYYIIFAHSQATRLDHVVPKNDYDANFIKRNKIRWLAIANQMEIEIEHEKAKIAEATRPAHYSNAEEEDWRSLPEFQS